MDFIGLVVGLRGGKGRLSPVDAPFNQSAHGLYNLFQSPRVC